MKKVITENELDILLNFIGYGRPDADIWFLGLEEAGGDEKLLASRLKFEQVEDRANAQKLLDVTLQQFDENVLQGSGRGMSEVTLRLESGEVTAQNIQDYLENLLGRTEGSTLLCNLLPLPVPPGGAWSYASLIPQYDSREAYYGAVTPLRYDFFRELISQYSPKIIIGYGRSAWPHYQEMLRGYKLSQSGQFLVGWDANTVVVLCDHFSTGEMDGKYADLVNLILENSLSIETTKPSGPIPLSKAELARQKKEAARQLSAAKRKPSVKHDPSDPYCVCAFCLGYEND